jgi:hypothetical protein
VRLSDAKGWLRRKSAVDVSQAQLALPIGRLVVGHRSLVSGLLSILQSPATSSCRLFVSVSVSVSTHFHQLYPICTRSTGLADRRKLTQAGVRYFRTSNLPQIAKVFNAQKMRQPTFVKSHGWKVPFLTLAGW